MNRPPRPFLRWLSLPPWIILVIGGLVTISAAAFTKAQIERTDHVRFDRLVSRTMLIIDSRLDNSIALLRGATGLFAASDGQASKEAFHAYARQLDLASPKSTFRALGFGKWVNGNGELAQQLLPATTHPWPDELHPMSIISMLEPQDASNQAALGYDMYSEGARRAAMDRSRLTRQPAATSRITLIQRDQSEQHSGFIIYMPVFSNAAAPAEAINGWVYGAFRSDHFFSRVLAESGVLEQVTVQVYDGSINEDALLYTSEPGADGSGKVQSVQTLDAAGRPWTVRITANAGFHANPFWDIAPVVAICLALTLSAAFAAWLQGHALDRARSAESEAQAARERAELLLKEVNHRVANSLQLVASLLDLQGAAMKDEGGRAALAATRARVMAVARVHQRLYVADEVQRVDLRSYLESLTEELESSLDPRGGKLRLLAEDVLVDAEQAVSAGIVVAELVTNAFKYAYPGAAAGEVRIRLARDGDNVRLSVEDDGVGLPARGVRPAGTGLGMTIVNAMAKNLDAQIDKSALGGGASIAVTFPLVREAS